MLSGRVTGSPRFSGFDLFGKLPKTGVFWPFELGLKNDFGRCIKVALFQQTRSTQNFNVGGTELSFVHDQLKNASRLFVILGFQRCFGPREMFRKLRLHRGAGQ